jgi:hypothetical protein
LPARAGAARHIRRCRTALPGTACPSGPSAGRGRHLRPARG